MAAGKLPGTAVELPGSVRGVTRLRATGWPLTVEPGTAGLPGTGHPPGTGTWAMIVAGETRTVRSAECGSLAGGARTEPWRHLSMERAANRLALAGHARRYGTVRRALMRHAAVLRHSGPRSARTAAKRPPIGSRHPGAASGPRACPRPRRTWTTESLSCSPWPQRTRPGNARATLSLFTHPVTTALRLAPRQLGAESWSAESWSAVAAASWSKWSGKAPIPRVPPAPPLAAICPGPLACAGMAPSRAVVLSAASLGLGFVARRGSGTRLPPAAPPPRKFCHSKDRRQRGDR
jgi:hypothetical protein